MSRIARPSSSPSGSSKRAFALSAVRTAIRALIAAAVLHAGEAHGQDTLRIGNVRLHLEMDTAARRDVSFASVAPEGGGLAGSLIWACGGDPGGLSVGVLLPDSVRSDTIGMGPRVPVAWSFDGDAPVTAFAEARWDLVRLLAAGDADAVAARARTAQRLGLRVSQSGKVRAGEFSYSLAGLDSALSRLRGSVPGAVGKRAGDSTLDRVFAKRDGAGGGESLAIAPLEEAPMLLNTSEVRQLLGREYPQLLRDAGIMGHATVQFRLLETGAVDAASIRVVAATHEAFGEAAVKVARRMRYRPARFAGRGVRVIITMPMSFSLTF